MKKTFLPSEAKKAIAEETCPACGAAPGTECPEGARRNSRRVAMKACAARIRLNMAKSRPSAPLSEEAAEVLGKLKSGCAVSESRPGSGVYVIQALPTRAIFGRTNRKVVEELVGSGAIMSSGTTGRHFYVATVPS